MTGLGRLPTYFISHGGGPWPWLDGDFRRNFDTLEASLKDMPQQLGRTPSAVLVISGHWETPEFSVMAAVEPAMIYDYSGFPEHTYRIRYPAPGSPVLAARVRDLLEAAGIPAGLDAQQGFDHGTFAPLFAIYPEANVPIVQLSLKRSYDPAAHLAAGRALAPLRDENVLIIGSGLSYHNQRNMGPAAAAPSKAFDDWLQQTLVGASPEVREQRLLDWEHAPGGTAVASSRGSPDSADGGGGCGRTRYSDLRLSRSNAVRRNDRVELPFRLSGPCFSLIG